MRQLPDLVLQAVRRWSLEVDERIDGGHFAHVVACRTAAGRQVVLRLVPYEVPGNVAMLRAWARAGAAPRVLAHDRTLGATLLVRIAGGTDLSRLLALRGAEPVRSLLERLHETPVPPEAPLVDVQPSITRGFARARRRVIAGTAGDVVLGDVRRATALASRLLAATPRRVALHGDLSPGNMLEADGGLVAIDPAPCFGPREIDAAFAALTGPWGTMSLPDRLDDLAADGPLDRAALYGWARALALERCCALWHDGSDPVQASDFLAFARNP